MRDHVRAEHLQGLERDTAEHRRGNQRLDRNPAVGQDPRRPGEQGCVRRDRHEDDQGRKEAGQQTPQRGRGRTDGDRHHRAGRPGHPPDPVDETPPFDAPGRVVGVADDDGEAGAGPGQADQPHDRGDRPAPARRVDGLMHQASGLTAHAELVRQVTRHVRPARGEESEHRDGERGHREQGEEPVEGDRRRQGRASLLGVATLDVKGRGDPGQADQLIAETAQHARPSGRPRGNERSPGWEQSPACRFTHPRRTDPDRMGAVRSRE